MRKRTITNSAIMAFEKHLKNDEKSENTVAKYLHDLYYFSNFTQGKAINKSMMLDYKSLLGEQYAPTSANSMIAAVNAFLRFMGWMDCCIKQFKVQKKAFCSGEKELTKAEYIRLVNTAKEEGNERLNLLLQTICGTGIRVSELQFITVEAVRKGETVVSCKNKTRTVFIVRELQKKLLNYIKIKGITTGCIFITKSGKPMSRCNICVR